MAFKISDSYRGNLVRFLLRLGLAIPWKKFVFFQFWFRYWYNRSISVDFYRSGWTYLWPKDCLKCVPAKISSSGLWNHSFNFYLGSHSYSSFIVILEKYRYFPDLGSKNTKIATHTHYTYFKYFYFFRSFEILLGKKLMVDK